MLTVEEASERILGGFKPLEAESVAIDQARGRILAAPAVAALTQPPHDHSAMDGYAVRSADLGDLPIELFIIGEAPAGQPFEGEVKPGEALRIFTGGALPSGADTIIIQENTERLSSDIIRIMEAAAPGRHIRRRGFDFTHGETLIEPGIVLGPRQIGLAAAANLGELGVTRKPVVAILATGSELAPAGSVTNAAGIANSNTPFLKAMVEARGGAVKDLGIAGDTPEALMSAIEGLGEADILVTIGGASVGDYDIVQETLGRAGLEVEFWKIAMKPGKPLIFGHYNGVPFFGLPGNPVSAAVTALIFLVPAIDIMLGRADPGLKTVGARLDGEIEANNARRAFIRAELKAEAAGQTVRPVVGQDSSGLKAMAEANALIVRAENAPAASDGDTVQVIPFRGL